MLSRVLAWYISESALYRSNVVLRTYHRARQGRDLCVSLPIERADGWMHVISELVNETVFVGG